jgi:hypothetical protein
VAAAGVVDAVSAEGCWLWRWRKTGAAEVLSADVLVLVLNEMLVVLYAMFVVLNAMLVVLTRWRWLVVLR